MSFQLSAVFPFLEKRNGRCRFNLGYFSEKVPLNKVLLYRKPERSENPFTAFSLVATIDWQNRSSKRLKRIAGLNLPNVTDLIFLKRLIAKLRQS
ncbi:MAG: hypothetical protein EOO96_00775 [Pedobacter sp.]|nr:MAG: hypothetical protein EOO96_00775 [Pedobacter sp.]